MNNTINTQKEAQNIVAYPDFENISRQRTNSSIIEHFIAFLFTKGTKINCKSIVMLIRNFVIILIIKILLEESKSYLDKFKFTNLEYVKYMYQYMMYSEKRYDIIKVSNKWTHNDKNISITNLTPFLESKSIYIQQPNTYYYQYNTFLIKVIITDNKITFCIPNVVSIIKYVDDIMDKYQEILLGNRTSMIKVTLSPSNTPQFNPMKLIYAFETNNYLKLKESLTSVLMVDSVLNIRQTPLCINFDGDPGTGKTTFGSYIAEEGIFDRIILYNLLQSSAIDFKTIIVDLGRIINTQSPKDKKSDGEQEIILLIFDEVDKYLDSYICNKIDSFRNEARAKKETKQNNEITVSESYTKLTVEEETDKKQQLKIEFLDKLYNLCDGQVLNNDKKYVIIFNTNNFESLFENAGQKYEALHDRFQQYKFKNNTKNDIIKFIDGIMNKIMNKISNVTTDNTKLYHSYINNITHFDKKIYEDIPEHINISYRSLSKILIDNCFDIPKSINYLSQNHNTDI